MAYVDQPSATEQDKLNQQSPLNQPPTTGGGTVGAAAGDKTPNQPSSSVAPAPFTNLGSYLAVNAPQIQGMAEKVSGQVGDVYGTTKGAIENIGANFPTQIAAGYAAPNQGLVEQAAANPTEFAATPENVSAFQAQYANKYTGPSSFEVTPDYMTAQGTVQKAVNDAANLGNYGGLQSYLATNLETNPTQAMSALDTALLSQSPEAISQINAQAAKFPSLTEYFNQAVAQQNQNIAGAQTAAQTAAQAAQNKFTGEGGVLPTFNADLSKRLADLRAAGLTENEAAAQAVKDLSSGIIRREDINRLVEPTFSQYDLEQTLGTLKNTYNAPFDVTGYLTNQSPEAQLTQANIATPADYAKAAALKQLIGGDYTGALNPDEAALAGTAPKDLSIFDYMKAQTDSAKALQTRDQDTLTNFPVGYAGNDPKTIAMLQDVYTRHADILNNNQKLWLDHNPVGGGGGTLPGGGTVPGDVYDAVNQNRAPKEGESKIQIITGPDGMPQSKWWDGSAWVKAPAQYQYIDKDGNKVGPNQNPVKTLKFNPDTGKYDDTGWTPPTTGSKLPPGVVVAF